MTEAKRKLATIQVISNITGHQSDGNLEIAHVLERPIIIRKGKFKIGENVVYVEMGTVCPIRSWSEYLLPLLLEPQSHHFILTRNYLCQTLTPDGHILEGFEIDM